MTAEHDAALERVNAYVEWLEGPPGGEGNPYADLRDLVDVKALDLRHLLSLVRGASEPSRAAKLLAYEDAHSTAVELGYPSVTEALEHLDRLRAPTAERILALLSPRPDVGTVEAAYREGYKDGFDRAVYEGEGPNPDLGWKLSDASHAPAQLERPGTADWQEVIERAIALIESEYPNQGPREPETRLRHDLRAMLAATPPSPEPNWLAMAQRAYEAQMADIHPAFARACTWDELAEIEGVQDKWVRVVKAAVGGMGSASADDGWRPTHRHVKRGTTYRVVAEGELQTTAQAIWDETPITIYQGEDRCWWARPTDEFNDGRFEPLPPHPVEKEPGR